MALDIEAANREAFSRIVEAEPVLADVRPAGEVIPGLEGRMVLYAGPPISWGRMCEPMRGAVAGAIRWEGWAPEEDSALRFAAGGGVSFRPNHDLGAVGPMTGITTPSMPVLVVENRRFGNRAFCTLNEGLGKVMRFGANDEEVLSRLTWMGEVLGPSLSRALRQVGGLPLKGLVAQALAMGDELHQRNAAATSLFLRAVAPALAGGEGGPEALRFIAGNDQFFLNLAMTLAKASLDPARGVEGSTLLTAMSRNGTEFAIRVSGLGDRWFCAPAPAPRGLYFAGFGEEDANPDMGDSAILETLGLGAFAMAAAPAVAGFVGAGGFTEALRTTREMGEITHGRHPALQIPTLDFRGVPTGIDLRKVVETGISPLINTGIAHRRAGVGQVGAGVVRAPMACFERALEAFAERYA